VSYPTAKLGKVATLDRQVVDPHEIAGGTLYVGLENIVKGGEFEAVGPIAAGELASSKFRFTSEHVLYGKLRPYLAKIVLPDFEGICSTDIIPILPGPDLDSRYLAFFLRTPRMIALASDRASGANLPRLSPNVLLDFDIPLPPLDEQRRIAAILDKAEKLRAKRRTAITLLDHLPQAIFLEMFGDPSTNPYRWPNTLRLEDVADLVSGITKGRKINGKAVREVPYLAVLNVQDKKLNLKTVKSIEATEEEIQRYRLKVGDLLLTEGGDPDKLGRGTIWNAELDEAIHQNHVFRVRLNSERVTPEYLSWLVGSAYGKAYFLRQAKQTTGIATINMGQLKAFPLLAPPLDLQHCFAARIDAIHRAKAAHQSALTELDTLMASIQSSAFAGHDR
jgi:type I restriction enzyme, S subunit